MVLVNFTFRVEMEEYDSKEGKEIRACLNLISESKKRYYKNTISLFIQIKILNSKMMVVRIKKTSIKCID